MRSGRSGLPGALRRLLSARPARPCSSMRECLASCPIARGCSSAAAPAFARAPRALLGSGGRVAAASLPGASSRRSGVSLGGASLFLGRSMGALGSGSARVVALRGGPIREAFLSSARGPGPARGLAAGASAACARRFSSSGDDGKAGGVADRSSGDDGKAGGVAGRSSGGGGSGGGAAGGSSSWVGNYPEPWPARSPAPPLVPPSAPHRPGSYPFASIEAKWQSYWESDGTFVTPSFSELDVRRPKFYALDMFPYPSGSGLHVGHPEGYTATDVVARYKRSRGFNVLHPIGWDAFGLPAEQYAILTGTPPAATTARNAAGFRRQLRSLGFSYDWTRELSTAHPGYYRWTQWIFARLAARGLAYRADQTVNWCPALGTVLANEEVQDGLSERGGHPVQRLPLTQWTLRITAYAEKLLQGLDGLDWDPAILEMQRNWIGKSTGADVTFHVLDPPSSPSSSPPASASGPLSLSVYTTRPETLFGATFVVVAPEHPLLDALARGEHRERALAYAAEARSRSDVARAEAAGRAGAKTGAFTGSHARNPATGAALPIFTADYVLGSYGSGAVMGVPAHDDRDADFAAAFGAPIVPVIDQSGGEGVMVNSERPREEERREGAGAGAGTDLSAPRLPPLSLNGLSPEEARGRAVAWLEETGLGAARTRFKLRDWLFARQRYWGEPFPIVYPIGEDAERSREGAGSEGSPGAAPPRGDPAPSLDAQGRRPPSSSSSSSSSPSPWWRRQALESDGMVLTPPADAPWRVLPDSELPLLLPPVADYAPTGSPLTPPLSKCRDWALVRPQGQEADGQGGEGCSPSPPPPPCAVRETSTMPQWAGSSWYYLRFIDPRNEERLVDPEAERYWMPVDLYVGGAEHAVLHLLYARFWHKALRDMGVVSTDEPFQRLVSQGMILGEVEHMAWKDEEKGTFVPPPSSSSSSSSSSVHLVRVPEESVTFARDLPPAAASALPPGAAGALAADPSVPVFSRAFKMSKSRGNVVNPDDVIAEHGADSLRLYEMFMGPLRDAKPWSTRGVGGVHRFLSRVHRLVPHGGTEEKEEEKEEKEEQSQQQQQSQQGGGDVPGSGIPASRLSVLHRTIAKVTEDTEAMRFNTAIATMMEYANEATRWADEDGRPLPRALLEPFVQLLAPYAPHLAEELWQRLGNPPSVALAPWPESDPELARPPGRDLAVQVDGKVRGLVREEWREDGGNDVIDDGVDLAPEAQPLFALLEAALPQGAQEDARAARRVLALAAAQEGVARFLAGKEIARVIYKPGKILNIVLKNDKKKKKKKNKDE